jgi:quinol monooxygenase YgiN
MTRSHLYLHAKAGRRDELLNALDRLEVLAAARREPGFLAVELQLPFDDEDGLLVWSAWASREHYERWLAGPACEDLLGQIGDLLTDEPVFRTYHVVDAIQSGGMSRL